MLRVLVLFEYPTLHGGENSFLTIWPKLRDRGVEAIAFAPPSGPLADALAKHGIEIESPGAIETGREKITQSRRREDLAAAIARLRPDLIHANSLAMSRLSGPVAHDAGIPSIGHVRDIVSLSRAAVADVNRHTRLLAVSQATRDWHVARGLQGEILHVCHNGVDLARFQPRSSNGFLHPELGLPRETLLLGSVGQIVIRKGLDVAAEAMREVMLRWRDVHWVIVGERHSQKDEAVEYECRLRELAKLPPLQGRAHFLGVRNDVDRIFNELTLLVHAARQEPLGRVLLEAAAAGLPIVATDVGGTEEVLPCNKFGACLIPVDDAPALAAAIDRLLASPDLRQSLAVRLRNRAEMAFDADSAAARILSHYLAVAAPNLS